MNNSSPNSLLKMANLLGIGCIFTVVGGYMDAYSYIVHGGVFATAQTGNLVFFAMYGSEGEWTQAFRHVPSLVAFIAGVAVANLLGVLPKKKFYRGTLFCQGIEFVFLCLLAAFSGFLPDDLTVPLMSFVAALQNTSFGGVGPHPFNSAITTGNIQHGTTGAVQWMMGRDVEQNRDKTIVSTCIVTSFLLGAMLGALFSELDPAHCLWPCASLVSIGFLCTWQERQKGLKDPPQEPAESKPVKP